MQPTVLPPDWNYEWPTYTLEVSDMDVKLPIEVVPNTTPPRFRWRQIVDGLDNERHVQMCEGALPAGADIAVETVVGVVNQLLAERAELLKQVETLSKRLNEALEVIAEQGKKIGSPVEMSAPEATPTPKPVDMPTTGKKLR